jgi:hypothetical protein
VNDAGEIAHASLRGAIAAMAMTGMRVFTVHIGVVDETPPRAIFRQRARGLLGKVPRGRRRAAMELTHWSYGAACGPVFGALPDSVRRRAWAGPVYGLLVWLAFELGLAPMLGLEQARRLRLTDRLGLAADHLLYGFVLSETRRRPRE